jgi:hypothetical protein
MGYPDNPPDDFLKFIIAQHSFITHWLASLPINNIFTQKRGGRQMNYA